MNIHGADYAIEPTTIPAIPVAQSDKLFPVHRVYCVGRNYAAHAVEMGHDPNKEPPFFFQKNPDNLNTSGEFPYPPASSDVHYEIEMVVALKSGGKDIPVDKALDCVFGYGVGLDMTRRDLQNDAKKQGRPWCIGKAFDQASPIGPLRSIKDTGELTSGAITLKVNGQVKQKGDLSQLIWNVGEIIEHLSAGWALQPGDLIYTGTPAGVNAVVKGDVMEGEIAGLGTLKVAVS